ncbi:MAG: hydroxymethylglutaryl-CoA lyase [Alphaproteobacteria bacterium]|nr:hydroxymethylglutaryl-CoA lyase [Alphaproteobacteria bacterium]
MALPQSVFLHECGPREGYQFEGIGQPDKISTADKICLIEALAETGVKAIQMTSFVNPKQVPQMADAEAVVAGVRQKPGINYSCIYLNDIGFKRALATGRVAVHGKLTLTASETFCKRNQKRDFAQDIEMQRRMAALYRDNNVPADYGSIMAAFGCNYEGVVPEARVIGMVARLHDIAAEVGSRLKSMVLADSMGWASPEQVRRVVGAVRNRWPDLRVGLHLHDTRGLAIANAYAGLLEGVEMFDTAVAGLGGCPFAGFKGAAGNVCTEEMVFLCQELGIETGIDLDKMVECARLAQQIVGHPVPSKLLSSTTRRPASPAAAA